MIAENRSKKDYRKQAGIISSIYQAL